MRLPKYIVKAYKLYSIKKGTAIELEETEAIPIEWMEEWLNDHGMPKTIVHMMIKAWRNEQ